MEHSFPQISGVLWGVGVEVGLIHRSNMFGIISLNYFVLFFRKSSQKTTYTILLGSSQEAATTLQFYRKGLTMGTLVFITPLNRLELQRSGESTVRFKDHHNWEVAGPFTGAFSPEDNIQGNI